jgi:hypothetical protein
VLCIQSALERECCGTVAAACIEINKVDGRHMALQSACVM